MLKTFFTKKEQEQTKQSSSTKDNDMIEQDTEHQHSEIEILAKRVIALEGCIAKMAHYNGGNNPKICREHGIVPWSPDKAAMTKYQ